MHGPTQGANAALQGRVRELNTELSGARAEAAALAGLQEQLRAASPDLDRMVEAAIARERAVQDARNAKVLELLASKVRIEHSQIRRPDCTCNRARCAGRPRRRTGRAAGKQGLSVSISTLPDVVDVVWKQAMAW